MKTIRVGEAILEGREVVRGLIDVLGLLEDVLHSHREAIGADGSTSHEDVKPGP